MRPRLPEKLGRSAVEVDGEEVFVYHEIRVPDFAPAGYYGDFHQWKIRVNGRIEMSIVRGPGTYGYSSGLFEIAFIDLDSDELSDLYMKDWDDTVLGYLTEDEVFDWYRRAKQDVDKWSR